MDQIPSNPTPPQNNATGEVMSQQATISTDTEKKKLQEDIRLSIRDIGMVVAELQFAIDDALAIASKKPLTFSSEPLTVSTVPSLSATPQASVASSLKPPATAFSQESDLKALSPTEEKTEEQNNPSSASIVVDNTKEQEEIKKSLSDVLLSPPALFDNTTPQTPPAPQVDLNVLIETPTITSASHTSDSPPQESAVIEQVPPIQQPQPTTTSAPASSDTVDYKSVLTVLSETGVHMLKSAIEEARKKQNLPFSEITDYDMVNFLLDEKNNEYLKEFGDLTPIRAVIKEKMNTH